MLSEMMPVAQDVLQIVLAGDLIDHRDRAMLPCKQVEQRVKRILALRLGQRRDGPADVFLIFRPGERRDADVLPTDQQ